MMQRSRFRRHQKIGIHGTVTVMLLDDQNALNCKFVTPAARQGG